MNRSTPNIGDTIRFPAPVVHDHHLPPVDGVHPTIELPDDDIAFDLATGECRVARVIEGVHLDTRASTLVASVGTLDIANGYSFRRLYRTHDLHWFAMRLEWWSTVGLWDDDFISPVADERVVDVARALVPDAACKRFLLEWYCGGFVPRCDASAVHWAQHALSIGDCQVVMDAIAHLPPLT